MRAPTFGSPFPVRGFGDITTSHGGIRDNPFLTNDAPWALPPPHVGFAIDPRHDLHPPNLPPGSRLIIPAEPGQYATYETPDGAWISVATAVTWQKPLYNPRPAGRVKSAGAFPVSGTGAFTRLDWLGDGLDWDTFPRQVQSVGSSVRGVGSGFDGDWWGTSGDDDEIDVPGLGGIGAIGGGGEETNLDWLLGGGGESNTDLSPLLGGIEEEYRIPGSLGDIGGTDGGGLFPHTNGPLETVPDDSGGGGDWINFGIGLLGIGLQYGGGLLNNVLNGTGGTNPGGTPKPNPNSGGVTGGTHTGTGTGTGVKNTGAGSSGGVGVLAIGAIALLMLGGKK